MAYVLSRILTKTVQRQLNAVATTTNKMRYMQTDTSTKTTAAASNATTKSSNATNEIANDDMTTAQKNSSNASLEQKLVISDSCIKRLQQLNATEDCFLRITVEGGGCSGFQYKFNLDNKLNDDDLVFGDGKAKVVIDEVSLDYCAGATIDYHQELIRSGFRMIANPMAEQGCSCGSSFSIKVD